MTLRTFPLHAKVLANLAARGDAGARWLAELPATVAALERIWNIQVSEMYPNSTEAFVAAATTASGEPAALKIPIPGFDKAGREIAILRAANGQGYVRLLRHDAASGAMLLEQLGPQLAQAGLSTNEMIAKICATLRKARMPVPDGATFTTGREKAQAMAAYIQVTQAKLGNPCSDRAIAVALRFAAARADAFDPATAVLGHGDAHCWNTLQGAGANLDDCKFVDPDGLFIEPAHDLSISLREWSAELLAGDPVALGRERCALLADLAGVAAQAIWQWGLIERLVNGLQYLDVGPQINAAEFLDVVEAWARAEAD